MLVGDAPGVFAYNQAATFLVKPTVGDYAVTAGDFLWPGLWASPLTIGLATAGAATPAL